MTEALKVLEKFLGYPFPIAFVLKTEVLEREDAKGASGWACSAR
jgi:hypothetical protein